MTFVLISGGHNAGIVSEPGHPHPHRHFRIRTRDLGGRTLGADEWEQDTKPQDGSWWLPWAAWLDVQSSEQIPAPSMGISGALPLCDAPGDYVRDT